MLVRIVENVAAKTKTSAKGRIGAELQVNTREIKLLKYQKNSYQFRLIYSSLIDQFFGGAFDIEMKCTETEDETPTFTQENFLQLSCFISQEVKYMLSGIKSVSE